MSPHYENWIAIQLSEQHSATFMIIYARNSQTAFRRASRVRYLWLGLGLKRLVRQYVSLWTSSLCDAVWTSRKIQTLRKNTRSPPSELKNRLVLENDPVRIFNHVIDYPELDISLFSSVSVKKSVRIPWSTAWQPPPKFIRTHLSCLTTHPETLRSKQRYS
jgi:hypothetical protein